MSNSSSGFRIIIQLNRPMAAASLTLIGSSFNRITSSASDKLEATVPAGMYQVCIEAPGYYQEEYIRVTGDASFTLDVKKVSAFPVAPYISTQTKQQESAREYSLRQTSTKETSVRPNFVFFFATYEANVDGVQLPFNKFTLYNDDVTIRFESGKTYYNEQDGVVVFSTHIPVGLYFLSYPEQKNDRIIPVYIFQEKQSQFFIRCSSKSKIVTPDFFNCRIFYSDVMEFDPKSHVYYVMERLLTAFSNFSYYSSLTSDEETAIASSSYLTALSKLLELAVKQSSPISKTPALDLPDLKYWTISPDDSAALAKLSDEIPTLSFVMYKFSKDAVPTSMLDRVAENVKYDLFWTSFTKIESRQSVAKDIQRAIWNTSTFGKVKNMIYNTLPFSGSVNIDEVQKELTAYTKQHIDGAVIAKKLNIPITTVIRKYGEYKKIYDSIIKKEKEMDNDDFFKKKSV